MVLLNNFMINTLISCNFNHLHLLIFCNKHSSFGNKNYPSLDFFLLFEFLSVKKFKNFKESFTKSFFLKLK